MTLGANSLSTRISISLNALEPDSERATAKTAGQAVPPYAHRQLELSALWLAVRRVSVGVRAGLVLEPKQPGSACSTSLTRFVGLVLGSCAGGPKSGGLGRGALASVTPWCCRCRRRPSLRSRAFWRRVGRSVRRSLLRSRVGLVRRRRLWRCIICGGGRYHSQSWVRYLRVAALATPHAAFADRRVSPARCHSYRSHCLAQSTPSGVGNSTRRLCC